MDGEARDTAPGCIGALQVSPVKCMRHVTDPASYCFGWMVRAERGTAQRNGAMLSGSRVFFSFLFSYIIYEHRTGTALSDDNGRKHNNYVVSN
jgi:hypothetical protein